MKKLIAILDFGSQYTQLIARRVRECKVFSRIYPYDINPNILINDGVIGIIFSGGPESVLSKKAIFPHKKIFNLKVPIMGICYGLQLIVHMLKGKVSIAKKQEYGHGNLTIKDKQCLLLKNIDNKSIIWNSHGDIIEVLPNNFKVIATSDNSNYCIIEDYEKKLYGLQFHPEVVHTVEGTKILQNFLYLICKAKCEWEINNYIKIIIENIKSKVGKKNVILALSGGIDSSVAAILIQKAIGKQLHCVFVDNGLLRDNEYKFVKDIYCKKFNLNLKIIRAANVFLASLKGVVNPEKKRKIIGRQFIKIFEKEIKLLKEVKFLAQGTLYSDVIESAPISNSPSAMIKSHHNVGGLPKNMKLDLLEPLRELFKDEVRLLGKELNIPSKILSKHPFPGPGLAVRIIGEITLNRLKILRKADSILIEELKKSKFYEKIWQGFCIFLPLRSVGVMGDKRTYNYIIAIRAVESLEGMTADWFHLPHVFLRHLSNRIINEVQGISRVVYDISSKPPSTIEWE